MEGRSLTAVAILLMSVLGLVPFLGRLSPAEPIVALLLVSVSLYSVFSREKMMTLLFMIAFGIGAINASVLFYVFSENLILLLLLLNAAGFIYLLSEAGRRAPVVQKTLYDFGPKEKKLMIERELGPADEPLEEGLPEFQVEKIETLPSLPDIKEESPYPYYVGSAKTGRFHVRDCRFIERISGENRIEFRTKADARKKGYIPCRCVS